MKKVIKMKITKKRSVKDLKIEFRNMFPKLKIEFYTRKHDHFEGSKEKELIGDDILLGDLNPELEDGTFEIKENMLVDEFETQIDDKFGLHTQVFRKSGNQWLQTSITDNWSLEKQERKAEQIEDYLNS